MTIGPLQCLAVQTGGDDPAGRIPVLMCHGYGAPGDDLASLAEPMSQWLGEHADRFRFVFPAAPRDLAEIGMPGGRAWWPLNMAALQQVMATSQFDQLHDSTPPGLDEARAALVDVIKTVLTQCDRDDSAYVLGGFSQGAMLTMHTTLTADVKPPKLLVQFSGTLICQSEWTANANRLAETDVLQSHGRIDPILPFSSADKLCQLVSQSASSMEFMPFDGPHTIDSETLMRLVQKLSDLQ
ncbi:MAG: lysophospholipase [Planctomycetota bacterium]